MTRETEVVPLSDARNGMTIYRMSSEDVEMLLAAKYGEKLMKVNYARLAKQNKRRDNQLKNNTDVTRTASDVL